MTTGGKIKLEEGTGGGTMVGFKAPDTEVTDECIWTLPSTDGTAGQVLATDGAKQLSWASGIDTSGASAGQVLVFNGVSPVWLDGVLPAFSIGPMSDLNLTEGVVMPLSIIPHGVDTYGLPPFSFILTDGSFPEGVTMSESGYITGTPSETGTFPVTVTATDGAGRTSGVSFTINVSGPIEYYTITYDGNGADAPTSDTVTFYQAPFNEIGITGVTNPPVTNWGRINVIFDAGSGVLPSGIIAGNSYQVMLSPAGGSPHYVVTNPADSGTLNYVDSGSGTLTVLYGNIPPFDLNDYTSGTTCTVLNSSLVNTGFTFVNWNTEALGTGTSYAPTDTFEVTADVTLYAQWDVVYTLTYDPNGAEGGSTVDPTQYTYEQLATVLPNGFTRTGYTFLGWANTGPGGSVNAMAGDQIPILANTTLWAVWAQAEATLVISSIDHNPTRPIGLVLTNSDFTPAFDDNSGAFHPITFTSGTLPLVFPAYPEGGINSKQLRLNVQYLYYNNFFLGRWWSKLTPDENTANTYMLVSAGDFTDIAYTEVPDYASQVFLSYGSFPYDTARSVKIEYPSVVVVNDAGYAALNYGLTARVSYYDYFDSYMPYSIEAGSDCQKLIDSLA